MPRESKTPTPSAPAGADRAGCKCLRDLEEKLLEKFCAAEVCSDLVEEAEGRKLATPALSFSYRQANSDWVKVAVCLVFCPWCGKPL
jgi:hypothetical protein